MIGLEDEARDLLARSILCRGLAPDSVEELARHGSLLEETRGQELYGEGEPAMGLLLVVRGVVKLVRALDSGRDIIIELLGRGDLLGEAALSDEGRADSRAVCVHPSTLLLLPRQNMLAFVASNPDAIRNVLAVLHASLVRAHQRVEDMAVFGVRQRIARFLIRLADWTGRVDGGRVHVPLALSRQELAGMVGTTMETTIRIMSALRREGLVEPARRGVVLPDREALALVAAGAS